MALTGASIWLTTTRLVTNTDQDDLVSEDLDYHRRYKNFLREFGDQEYLYIVVETNGEVARAQQFVDALVPRLEAIADVREVVAQIDTSRFEPAMLLYLAPDQLKQLTTALQTPGFHLADLAQFRGLDDIFATMAEQLRQEIDPRERDTLAAGFRIFDQMIHGLLDTAQGKAEYESPFRTIHQALGESQINAEGYITAGEERFLFVMIMPQKDYATLEVIAEPLARIRGALDATRAQFPGIVWPHRTSRLGRR